jgi:hypothetical protein
MKIPVCKADFDNQAITKIARLVSKTSHSEKIGLSKAKEVLAIALGYKDYHDLNKSICEDDPSPIGSPGQIKRAIADNVATRFTPDLSHSILSSLEYWGIHRLRIFTVSQQSTLPSEVIKDISRKVSVCLGQHLGRRLSMSKPLPAGAVADYLSRSLPPLFVVKDLVHEEINDTTPDEYSCLPFLLNEYRMLVKQGGNETTVQRSINLEPVKIAFLRAVSMEFDSQLAVDIPAFLARYGLSQQKPRLNFHDLPGFKLFD